MMGNRDAFNEDIDWAVYKKQQTIPESMRSSSNDEEAQGTAYSPRTNVPLGKDLNKVGKYPMIDTILGKMPDPRDMPQYQMGTPENRQVISEMIGGAIGGPGMKILGAPEIKAFGGALNKAVDTAKPIIGKGIQKSKEGLDYLTPSLAAEEFRSGLSQGTSRENIAELSQRAQFAKKSAQEEALIPKRELYSQEGKSNVYNVGKESLPEGNIEKFSHIIAPGEKLNESQANAISKAIDLYRKGKMNKNGEWLVKPGDIEHFQDVAEDVFGIPELGPKAVDKVEDALLMPTKRNSAYFSDKEVTDPYSKKGNLINLHNAYEKNPVLDNYQDLRSAITTQMRKLKVRAKTDDVAAEKYDQMKMNLDNLDKDANNYIQTLPEKMKDLDRQFREKYTDYATTYTKGEKETGASLTLRRLAEGRHDLVSDNDVVKLFSKPTAADKKAILDMGEGAARNAIYSALQRVPVGDAKGMAETLLDLKRTKGFDKIITPEIETWANNMIKQTRIANIIKKSSGVIGGATVGGALGGIPGAVVGAALPWGKELAGSISKMVGTKFKK